MEELIFFGVIIFFSILDSVARSRRARRARESGESGESKEEPELFEWAQQDVTWEDDVPSYDQDPSYDDEAEKGGGVARPPSGPGERSIAAELLEALEKLSRPPEPDSGARPRSLPRTSPPLPSGTDTGEAMLWERAPDREAGGTGSGPLAKPGGARSAEHYVHASHAGYGTDPSSRAPSEQDGLDPLAEPLNRAAAAVRSQLQSGHPDALRQALILHEVLGPPLSDRE